MSIGSFTRYTSNPAEEDPLNVRVTSSLNGTFDELPDTFENWSAPQVKEAVQGLQREDQVAHDRLETQKNGDAFVAGHPEFIDNTANAHLLFNQMNTMFGEGLHTLDHFEKAYEYLRTKTNFLKLNQAELAKQQKVAAKQRFDAAQKPVTPSQQDLYNMPLEDLRRLDAIAEQSRLQREGETGGW